MAKKSKRMNRAVKMELKKSGPIDPLSEIKMAGTGADEVGRRYFRIRVRRSGRYLGPYAMSEIIGGGAERLYNDLANAGVNFFMPKSKSRLIQLIEGYRPTKDSFEVATQLGWHGAAFVLPNETIVGDSVPVLSAFSALDSQMLSKYRVRGTLEDWQAKIAKPCIGNSRLMFSVALAFTGPILPYTNGSRSGGFQICGDPETGKTTAAMVAGSVWGCHREAGKRERGF